MTDAFPIISVPQQRLSSSFYKIKSTSSSSSSSSSLSFIKSNFCSIDQVRCAVIPTPYFAENNNNNKNDDINNNNKSNPIVVTSSSSINNNNIDDTTTSTTASTTSSNNNNKSILQMIDEMAQQIKIAALQANAKAALYTNNTGTIITLRQRIQQYKYYIQSILYYILFLFYRGYRGFFIILPAIYKNTYNKLQYVIDNQPFELNNNNNINNDETIVDGSDTTTTSLSSSSDMALTTTSNTPITTSTTNNQLNLRTRIVISIISTFIILSYVTSGAIRVLQSFIQSLFYKQYTIPQSLQNAIQQQEENEIILLQKNKSKNQK